MKRKVVTTSGAPKAIGPYSQAIVAGDYIFVSGQIPLHPETGEIVGNTIEEQTERVLENVKAIVESAGSSMDMVVKTTVYMSDLNEFGRMNEVYARYFSENPPARAAVEVSKLPKGVKIEIEAVALL